eukprot:9133345-Heterocapsa_arctica.AAC.1
MDRGQGGMSAPTRPPGIYVHGTWLRAPVHMGKGVSDKGGMSARAVRLRPSAWDRRVNCQTVICM